MVPIPAWERWSGSHAASVACGRWSVPDPAFTLERLLNFQRMAVDEALRSLAIRLVVALPAVILTCMQYRPTPTVFAAMGGGQFARTPRCTPHGCTPCSESSFLAGRRG